MKRIINKFIIFVAIFISLLFIIPNASAKDLDRINEYIIQVDPNYDDGSLDIKIDVKWTVLDSKSEGPLEWVKIGVPNYHVDNLKTLTNNIKKISYYSDDGAYIRLDLDRKYNQGETVDFSFSFNQSYMYHVDGNYLVYDYNPGYFDDILVDKCVLKWNKNNILDNNTSVTNVKASTEGDYLVYESALSYGEYIKVNYTYERNHFNYIDESKSYTDKYENVNVGLVIFVIACIVAFIVIVFLIERLSRDPYETDRGFYMPSNWLYYWNYNNRRYTPYKGVSSKGKPINPPKTVSGGFSGGHSSCACACACAGGGRAGCSFKDFYHTNIKTKDLKKVTEK